MSNPWWLGTNRRPRSSSDSVVTGHAIPEPETNTQNEFSEAELQKYDRDALEYHIFDEAIDASPDRYHLVAPEAAGLAHRDEIVLDSCRHCSEVFQYTWMQHTTKVIVGLPKISDYQVASYVWGDTRDLPLRCRGCGKVTNIPMESADKFRRLMSLAEETGDSIWIDAISIDQSDPLDVSAQVAMMGEIYGNAKSVGVLLPKEDKAAFKLLLRIAYLATCINQRYLEFSRNQETLGGASLSMICADFYEAIENFESGLPTWLYWSRAWTFQEWALAKNFSVSWEGPPLLPNIGRAKKTIIHAATLLAVYKLSMQDYATIRQPFSRGFVARKLHTVKRLFPDERAFTPADFIDEGNADLGMNFPSLATGASDALGLTILQPRGMFSRPPILHESFILDAPLPDIPKMNFSWRLCIALNALGTHKRQAKYEADLVTSWASMCCISYEYNKHDTFAVALQKVVKVIRLQLMFPVYSFHINTIGTGGEVDLNFLDYASGHRQSNSTNDAYFHGTPIFNGRADAAVHFRISLSQPKVPTKLEGSGVMVQKVLNASIKLNADWDNYLSILTTWRSVLSGHTGEGYQFNFTHVLEDVGKVLLETPRQQLEHKALATVLLEVVQGSEMAKGKLFMTWAICSGEYATEDIFVVRESLNGTLALACNTKDGRRLLAYLTITDQQCGTMLVKLDEDGNVRMTLKTPLRGDIGHSIMHEDRELNFQIPLEADSLLAF